MSLDGKSLAAALEGEAPFVNTQLCRAQLDNFSKAAASGEPLLVCCTQEAPLFIEVAGEQNPDANIAYVNIRERAGWSDQGKKATAKTAALIAEAAVDMTPASSVALTSGGETIVYGDGEVALEVAKRLSSRLNVTCVLKSGADAAPPRLTDFPIFSGTITAATGRIGAFNITVKGLAAMTPSSRREMSFESPVAAESKRDCDLLVDVSGAIALFPAPDKRDGYFRADPGNAQAVERAVFDAADMVGEFEKPRYIRFEKAVCAHSRNGKTGCTRCLGACPTSAIRPDGDQIIIDPYICSGHGACASVCPTGAISYDMPSGNGLHERLRILLKTYAAAGGENPVLLVHDLGHGDQVISMMARHGRGLPAHVIPFAINEVTQIGIDFISAALAYGASTVHILASPAQRDDMTSLYDATALANTVMTGLGFAGRHATAEVCEDPSILEEYLYGLDRANPAKPAGFQIVGSKRATLSLTLKHLHGVAPSPVDILPLEAGAPFGAMQINADGCTLCLACVGVCPVGAIGDNPDKPQLRFMESSCVQCGLCRATCPEKVITLVPQINFSGQAGTWAVLKEEEPFECIKCGKPYGSRSTIEHMIGKLQDHPMFSDGDRIDLLKMCDDCRVGAQFEKDDNPFAAAPRPLPRTTDDYLQERDQPPAKGGNGRDRDEE